MASTPAIIVLFCFVLRPTAAWASPHPNWLKWEQVFGVWRRILEEKGTKAWLLSVTRKRFGLQTEPVLAEWYADEGN